MHKTKPHNKSISVLNFGETVWEDCNGRRAPCSPSILLAAYFARLSNTVAFYGRVGADDAGTAVLETLQRFGVDTKCIQRDNRHPTATATVTLAPDGKSVVSYNLSNNGAHNHIAIDEIALESLSRTTFDIICFQTLIQSLPNPSSTLAHLLNRIEAREVFYDVNIRGDGISKNLFENSLRIATIFRCNEEEMRTMSTILFGRAMRTEQFTDSISKTYAIPLVCVRMNDGGAVIYHAGSLETVPSPRKSPVPYPHGSGAAFNATFLTSICTGASPLESALRAVRMAEHAASRPEIVADINDATMHSN